MKGAVSGHSPLMLIFMENTMPPVCGLNAKAGKGTLMNQVFPGVPEYSLSGPPPGTVVLCGQFSLCSFPH